MCLLQMIGRFGLLDDCYLGTHIKFVQIELSPEIPPAGIDGKSKHISQMSVLETK